MGFCTSCGNTVQPGKFCTICGTKAPDTSQSSATPSVQSKFCVSCGKELSGKFCTGCGTPAPSTPSTSSSRSGSFAGSNAPLPKKCPSCNAAVTAKFCTNCGVNVLLESPKAAVSAPSSPVVVAAKASHTNVLSKSAPITPPNRSNSLTSSDGASTKTELNSRAPTPAPFQKIVSQNSLTKTTGGNQFSGKPCSNCGVTLDSKFCTSCGHNNSDLSTPKVSTTSPSLKGSPKLTPPPPSKGVPPPPPTKETTPSITKPSIPVKENKVPPPPPPKKTTLPVKKVTDSPSASESEPPPVKAPRPPPGPRPVNAASINNPKPPVESKPSTSSHSSCPKCGAQRETKFCTQCGFNPDVASPSSSPSPPVEGESNLRKWKQVRSASMSSIRGPKVPESCPQCGAPKEMKFCTQCGFSGDGVPAEDSEEDEDKRKTVQLVEPVRRSWKKKYDTLKKDQRITPPTGTPEPPPKISRDRAGSYTNLDPKTRVIREIIDTEDDYIQDLQIIMDVFLSPMRKEQIASTQEIGAIFSNIEMILGVNQQLLAAFQKNETAKGIGEAFIKMAEFLKMYANYCSNQNQSFETINKLKAAKDKKFETFLQYCFAKPECQGLDFNAYLIKPVQRICKYPLLLRELISKTEPSHEDYPKLQEAFTKVESIVGSINEKKRESELNNKMYEIAGMISSTEGYEIISPTRRYIKEGEVSHYNPNGKIKSGYYFLFNDLFLYTKKKGTNKYILLAFAHLSSADLRYVSTYEKPTFELVISGMEQKVWPLVFETEDQKFKFMEELQELIEKSTERAQNMSRRNSAPLTLERRQSLLGRTQTSSSQGMIVFECEYWDKRRVEIPRNNLSFEVLQWAVLQKFQVEACTIMHGETFIDSQNDLEQILADGQTTYDLLLYDPY